jgi:serine protease inhibitor
LQVEGLDDIEKQLDGAMINDITSGMNLMRWKVDLILPKFTIKSDLDLKTALLDLGVTDMFDKSAADFSGITGRPNIYVSNALHKAYVEVNEEGTEASASTGISYVPTSILLETQVKVDRPFLMIVKERSTGAVLFMGRLVVPPGAEEFVKSVTDDVINASGRSLGGATVCLWISVCTLFLWRLQVQA